MAAHAFTALSQIAKSGIALDQMNAALNFSCWTEDLRLRDWREFRELVDISDVPNLQKFAASILDFYETMWRLLGEPSTRFDWSESYFSGTRTRYEVLASGGSVFHVRSTSPARAMFFVSDTCGVFPTHFRKTGNKIWRSLT